MLNLELSLRENFPILFRTIELGKRETYPKETTIQIWMRLQGLYNSLQTFTECSAILFEKLANLMN